MAGLATTFLVRRIAALRIISKYLTPPLSNKDRWTFYQAMGLDQLTYLFVETGEKHIFSAKKVEGQRLTPSLEPRSPDGIATWAAKAGLPVVCVCHGATALPTYSPFAEQTLWETLFPHPFSTLGISASDASVATEAFPLAFACTVDHLQKAFQRLEKIVAEFEVSFLWVKPENRPPFPLLFHYVRRKRIRVGTSPLLSQLGRQHENMGKNSRELIESFGTRCLWIPLSLSEPQSSDPLENLAIKLEQSLDAISASVGNQAPRASTASPRPEIRL